VRIHAHTQKITQAKNQNNTRHPNPTEYSITPKEKRKETEQRKEITFLLLLLLFKLERKEGEKLRWMNCTQKKKESRAMARSRLGERA